MFTAVHPVPKTLFITSWELSIYLLYERMNKGNKNIIQRTIRIVLKSVFTFQKQFHPRTKQVYTRFSMKAYQRRDTQMIRKTAHMLLWNSAEC